VFSAEQAAPLVREATSALLGARDRLGQWQNAAGSVAMVRALSVLPNEKPEPQKASVRIHVDGEEVAKASIDPRDPFTSALAVAEVDITAHLPPGKHTVSVHYSGVNAPYARVHARRYVAGGPGKAIRFERTIGRSELTLGQTTPVTLKVGSKPERHHVAIEQPLPGLFEVERSSLDELVKQRRIAAYHLGERLVVYLDRLAGDVTLELRMRAIRSGRASLPPAIVRPLHGAEASVIVGNSQVLVVR
jgi:uncharacterized protein YfaS (alpha-2-macroglobulin family)